MDRAEQGRGGEQAACRYLARHGCRILGRNVRCRQGEIDIVAAQGETLLIVEVKTRSRSDYGTPAEAVGWSKRRRIVAAARYYLALHPWAGPVRFDVVEVYRSALGGQINWIPNAFEVYEA